VTQAKGPALQYKPFPRKEKPLASAWNGCPGEPSEGHVAREILSCAGEEPLFNLPEWSVGSN